MLRWTWMRIRNLGRLGLLGILALLTAMASLAGFALLAEEVLEFDELQQINLWVRHLFLNHGSPEIRRVVEMISTLGDADSIATIGLLTMGVLMLRKRFLDALTLVVVLLGGTALMLWLKFFFGVARPGLNPSTLPDALNTSFPSGHAMLSMCLYGFLALWLVRQNPRQIWRWCLAVPLLALPVAIGWSRVYLDVHWFSDVIAGNLAALFWVSVCLAMEQATRRNGLPPKVNPPHSG